MRPGLLLLALAALVPFPAAAMADDLYLLDGDAPLDLHGTVTYGTVYVDSGVVLSGNGELIAGSVYFGPNAYVDGCPDGLCGDGRSLEIRASGAVVLANGIDLEGSSGDGHAGGSLTVTGSRVTIGGGTSTAGHGAPSGDVRVTSAGTIALGELYAPGADVRLQGAGITTGQIYVAPGYQSSANGAGDVTVHGSGDVRTGAILAAGGNGDALVAPGRGGVVALSGRSAVTGGVEVGGGRGNTVAAGDTGSLTIHATGGIATGSIGVQGGDGDGTTGRPGGTLDIRTSGDVQVGDVYGPGGSAVHAGGVGAAVVIRGRTIRAGDLWLQGGNAGTDAVSTAGGAGGSLDVRGTGAVAAGIIGVFGGNAGDGAGPGGAGGTVGVRGSTVQTGQLWSTAGNGSTGPGVGGAIGGPITLRGSHGLVVAGGIDSEGADARSDDDPAPAGGAGGAVLLDAGDGVLEVTGVVRTGGGRGADGASATAGTGGRAGPVDLIAGRIASIAGLYADGGGGGFYGDREGAGGAGGLVRSWSASDPFDATHYVSTAGGGGTPTGADGLHQRNQPPLRPALSNGRLRFASRSPGATAYRVYLTLPGARPSLLTTTSATSRIRVRPLDPCRTARLTVVAVQSALAWVSAASPPLVVRRRPSACR